MQRTLLFCVLIASLISVSSKSFTVVIDTTISMQDEIDIIKNNIRPVVEAVRGAPHIENFVLVPFNDPGIGNPLVTTSPEQFLNSIYSLTTSGGTDCPENTLAGIRKGLEVSQIESYVYVFTDAFAKDYNEAAFVKDFCRNTQSKVNVFLSGFCPSRYGTIDLYRNITSYCSGAVLNLNPVNFRKAFSYMKEISTVDWNNIVSYPPFDDRYDFQISISPHTTNLLIVLTGKSPVLSFENNTRQYEEIIYDQNSFLAIRVKAEEGNYKLIAQCEECSSLTIYKQVSLQFRYGFSSRLVKNFKETSSKPIPDAVNYILISWSNSDTIRIRSVELQTTSEHTTVLEVQPVGDLIDLFYATVYIANDKNCRIIIYGYDLMTSEKTSGSSGVLTPQKPGIEPPKFSPIIEIIEPDNSLLEFGSSVTIASRVTGYPKPDIVWEDQDQRMLPSEDVLLEMPSVYISYVTISNITYNGTLYCKAKNWEGEDIKSIELFVNKTAVLDVIQSPQDEDFEYGTEGKLFCEVVSYPEAIITWYHNETLIEDSDNIEIIPEEHILLIKSMGLDDTGEYKCEVTNIIETKTLSATVSISGLEAPEIETENSEVSLKPGDVTDIECRAAKGTPEPVITWQYKSFEAYDFTDVPEDVIIDGGKLQITTVRPDHSGIYKCEGSNILGQDSQEITLKIQYAPIIKDNEEKSLIVKEGRFVELPCEVDAVPKARVRWEMSQDDVIMALSKHHYTDDKNIHRFYALWKDSGIYHCIAENEFGKAEKRITVNVLVPPYIQYSETKTEVVPVGSTVRFPCNVRANPAPTTTWEYIAPNSYVTVLSRGNATNTLVLNSITKSHEGIYRCIAENSVGTDTIKIFLKVQ